MPRNRRPQDREEKRAEIVVAARRLFVEEGYDAASMTRIARDAGVVSNTLYWYFQDKDAVLIAVLEAVLADSMAAYSDILDSSLADRLLWLVGELEQLGRLVSTVHTRAAESAAIGEWHEQFHALAEGLFRAELIELGVPGHEVDPLVTMGVFVVEGLLTHPAEQAQRRAVIETLLNSARGLAAAAG
ncbi:TetR/AcrR family transcriptional regulator [Nocardia yamanashiensis]|uniref:TetR/AcrR family transcriptional regulator n=1 Tax=Nocardia yamanashiensis TaxID=209247 RepID=UPI001E57F156|nr:TetR/AcrR family transcriptional regulator [Nocardia yamanashiensis]UGT44106.1 TetR/AcrR family transcriptional regulator [Nocardia yamanashiensis]